MNRHFPNNIAKRIGQTFYLVILLFGFISCISSVQKAASPNSDCLPKLEIHVINVGQGDCFLIISPYGDKILIDAGNNGKGTGCVLPYLLNLHIVDLDYIVASHYHSDHIGGLDEVVLGLGGSTHIKTAAYDRGGNYSSRSYLDYVNAIGDKRVTLSAGQTIDLADGVRIECIASNGNIHSGKVYDGIDENTLSVVFILRFRNFDMYFGGDSDLAIEPYLASYAGDVDIYKVSHHGSNTSSSQELLDYLQPEVSIIPVGSGNQYGHPHFEAISRLINMNSYIYQTETGSAPPPIGKGEVANGDFKIVTDGFSYTISGASLIEIKRPTDSYQSLAYLMNGYLNQLPLSFKIFQ